MPSDDSSHSHSRDRTQRMFLAVSPPEPVRALIAGLATPLREVRWTPADQLHVTLRFLGDVPEEKITPLVERLTSIRVEPFLLPVEGVGVFPNEHAPRVLWIGVGAGHPRLHQLRQRVDDALLASGLDVDLRTFHPHITVARCGDLATHAIKPWLRKYRDFAGPTFRVESFGLFSSVLTPAGAIHEPVSKIPLLK